jgi:hypothetical protein
MNQGGEQPIDEHQTVLRTGAYCSLPLPGGEPGLVVLVPQRADLNNEFSNHFGCQASDPPVASDHCTSRIPHHTTMINNQEPDVSPPTVHELVKGVAQGSVWAGQGR